MFEGRRAGTLTTGIVLVVFGLLFIARLVLPHLDFNFILSLWPLILILLGVEIIAYFIINKEEKMKYDGGAIALMIILSLFTMAMAGAEFAVNHLLELRNMF